MPSGGRNRVGNAIKAAAGTYRPDRHRDEPRYLPKAPSMPRDLPADAAKVWNRLVPEMEKANLLAQVDLDVLTLFCTKAAKFYRNWGINFKAGEVSQYRMLMCELGLTPASRLRTPPLAKDRESDNTWQDDGKALEKAVKSGKVTNLLTRLSTTSKTSEKDD